MTERARIVEGARDHVPAASVAVSVIMPVRDEAAHIREAVLSVLEGDFERDRLEVLVVDGMSTDGTREIVRELQQGRTNLHLLDNPARTVPHALNIGLEQARGEIIIRVDGHAAVAPNFIRVCLEELDRHPECGCVGGAIENVAANETSRAISLAMSSPFGVGGARFRLGSYDGYVDTLAFGAYRREVFDRVGGFDEALVRNQDDEFNHRMRSAGYRIWMSSRIRSRYAVRSSFRKLFRQYYQYGYWKVYVNRKHRTLTSLRQLVPAAMVSTLSVLAVAAPWSALARTLFAVEALAYLLGVATFSARLAGNPVLAAKTALAFATMHWAYGIGYIEGMVHFLLMRRHPSHKHAVLTR